MNRGVLLVLDGWGHAPPGPGNAIAAASTPTLDALVAGPCTRLVEASGRAVGLPAGVVGNSEIGHLVIGAGRALDYDSLLVEQAVATGALRSHPALLDACARVRAGSGTVHLVGLVSDGRIHADIEHFGELLHAISAAGVRRVAVHAITDGRDVANGTAPAYLSELEAMIDAAGTGRITTVVGRNLAMDKSGNVTLTRRAAVLVCDADGERAVDAAVDACTGDDGATPPAVVGRPQPIVDGDVVLFVNYRSDRTAPLVDMIAELLGGSGRSAVVLLSVAQYDTNAAVTALVERADASGGLADALQATGIRSVRIAEREKFEHVTFFVNGRDTRPRPFEEHVCVPGKPDPVYTDAPQMHVADVASAVNAAIDREDVGLVVANLANIDVVGHTGEYGPTVLACEAVDAAVADIARAAEAAGRWMLIVGDHGNGEQMSRTYGDGTPEPYGGHTHNPVPCALMLPDGQRATATGRGAPPALPAVAPTVLHLLGVDIPAGMAEPLWRRTGAGPDPKGRT